MSSNPQLLTPEQFWRELSGAIGRTSIYEFLRAGKIRSIRVGKQYRIPASEVQEFIEREAK